ncbi:MAG: lipase family protein [Crocinitomicaceae bacterium]|nr:lipase family protein [Crocinitomicaceae bacterium]
MLKQLIFTAVLFSAITANAYNLKPGFDKDEYYEMIKVNIQHSDSLYNPNLPISDYYKRVYRSEVMGLENRWELWLSEDSTVVVSVRGTVMSSDSWKENFYAAMVPAKGELQVSEDYNFKYDLSDHSRAAVHVGWLIGTAFIVREVQPKLDSLYQLGYKNVLITGHSQGGALATLINAYLMRQQQMGNITDDIVFKTYASAGPKVGNLYFAYSYENLTKGGWAFNVVNTADWVPEGPFSVQTVNDYNLSNPFSNMDEELGSLPFFQRVAAKKIYKDLSKPSLKANKRYQKYLGKMLGIQIKESLEGYEQPEYFDSNNYARVGQQIILYADETYYKIFPEKGVLWNHHRYEAYIYLLTGDLIEMNN